MVTAEKVMSQSSNVISDLEFSVLCLTSQASTLSSSNYGLLNGRQSSKVTDVEHQVGHAGYTQQLLQVTVLYEYLIYRRIKPEIEFLHPG